MKRVYDMSTGQIVDNGLTDETTQLIAPDASVPALQLQLVTTEQRYRERDSARVGPGGLKRLP